MNKIILILLSTLLISSQSILASPLSDAKASGVIKELKNGYVKAESSAASNVRALAADINQRRKAAYAKIAKSNGVTIETVAAESYKKRTGN